MTLIACRCRCFVRCVCVCAHLAMSFAFALCVTKVGQCRCFWWVFSISAIWNNHMKSHKWERNGFNRKKKFERYKVSIAANKQTLFWCTTNQIHRLDVAITLVDNRNIYIHIVDSSMYECMFVATQLRCSRISQKKIHFKVWWIISALPRARLCSFDVQWIDCRGLDANQLHGTNAVRCLPNGRVCRKSIRSFLGALDRPQENCAFYRFAFIIRDAV